MTTTKTRTLLFFVAAAFLLSTAMPGVSFAAKPSDASRQLRHGIALIGPPPDFGLTRFADVPGDVVLTDLVVSAVSGAEYCNVALAEHRSGTWISMAHVFPTNLDGSRQLHFESGLRPNGFRRAVIINNDCNVHVLWSGYTDAP